jgi:hypothetical protein
LASSWASKTPRGITCANWPLSSSSSSSPAAVDDLAAEVPRHLLEIGGDCGCCRAAADRY